jgi:FAD/FMN-containing dehydrogenase
VGTFAALATMSETCPVALASLKASFKGDLITPKDPGYDLAISRWAKNAARRARLVAFVKDEEDVALAIQFAKGNKLPLAVKSGGHSAGGASSAEGGIVIDLSRYIKDVKIDPDRKVAFVGGGAIWGSVDAAAIEHGLATVAGTVYHVCLQILSCLAVMIIVSFRPASEGL